MSRNDDDCESVALGELHPRAGATLGFGVSKKSPRVFGCAEATSTGLSIGELAHGSDFMGGVKSGGRCRREAFDGAAGFFTGDATLTTGALAHGGDFIDGGSPGGG